MLSRRRLVIAALVGAAGIAGCSAGPGPVTKDPSPSVSASRPPDGVSLRQLGFTNGPVDEVYLPTGVSITRRVDQVNVTTAFGPAADGPSVLGFLRRTLPPDIWAIDTDAGGSLLFHSNGYTGAFTQSPDLWALTLRRR